jgi:Cytochrome c
MKSKRTRGALLVCGLGVTFAVSALAWQKRPAPPQTTTREQVERGHYLVEEVAKCAECHTRRKANGDLDPEAWLQGAPIWIRPVMPIQPWADRAPELAGLPSYTTRDMERVLEQGTGPNGEALRPPMHIYHMTHEDALAIIAYLKSLPAPMH